MIKTVNSLFYHVAFAIGDDSRRITRDLREDLFAQIAWTVRSHGGSLIELGGISDHVHLLLRLGSEHSLADAVRVIKVDSARWINRSSNGGRRFSWQPGFAAFSVGEPQLGAIVDYLRRHERLHRSRSFSAELAALAGRGRWSQEEGAPFG